MNEKRVTSESGNGQGRIINRDEQKVKDHLGEMVRSSVEERLCSGWCKLCSRWCEVGVLKCPELVFRSPAAVRK